MLRLPGIFRPAPRPWISPSTSLPWPAGHRPGKAWTDRYPAPPAVPCAIPDCRARWRGKAPTGRAAAPADGAPIPRRSDPRPPAPPPRADAGDDPGIRSAQRPDSRPRPGTRSIPREEVRALPDPGLPDPDPPRGCCPCSGPQFAFPSRLRCRCLLTPQKMGERTN